MTGKTSSFIVVIRSFRDPLPRLDVAKVMNAIDKLHHVVDGMVEIILIIQVFNLSRHPKPPVQYKTTAPRLAYCQDARQPPWQLYAFLWPFAYHSKAYGRNLGQIVGGEFGDAVEGSLIALRQPVALGPFKLRG